MQSEQDRRFVERLRDWWRSNSKGVTPIVAGQLAPGIICIADKHTAGGREYKEVDIFFDLERYHLKDPALWEGTQSQAMQEAKIGYLPGTGIFPPVKTPDDAFRFARRQISCNSSEVPWGEFRMAEEVERALL